MIKAVIFDMDGVVIDTTGFWTDAEKVVFGEVGVEVTEELAAQTAGMSTTQVTEFWYEKFPWDEPGKDEVEQKVVDRVGEWIDSKGQAIEGFFDLLEDIQSRGLKVGLATNSPRILVDKVLRKLGLREAFDVVVSFDDVEEAKPSPEVYLKCLAQLSVEPREAIIIEDSETGVEAGLAAGCRVFHLTQNAIGSDADDRICKIVQLGEVIDFLANNMRTRRIVIFGNSGSGKSSLAKRYASTLEIAHFDLDTITWDTTFERRAIAESIKDLVAFMDRHDSWVIEGCYASLVEVAAKRATEMIFLNPGLETCFENCRARPWEPHKYATKEEQDGNLNLLLDWVAEYETRTDDCSLREHRAVFDAYDGVKYELQSNQEAGEKRVL